jgi:hypothetical protein
LQAIQTIDSPIYVGLLGRYSHGKTALINQFFSMTQEYALPEGEGIVTSKVTEITFLNEDFGLPQCLEVSRDGSHSLCKLILLKILF